jgi:hypothetical protein
MLNDDQLSDLSDRIDQTHCTDPAAGDGLFLYVLRGEPDAAESPYASHLEKCEHCRLLLVAYRHKREVALILDKAKRET